MLTRRDRPEALVGGGAVRATECRGGRLGGIRNGSALAFTLVYGGWALPKLGLPAVPAGARYVASVIARNAIIRANDLTDFDSARLADVRT